MPLTGRTKQEVVSEFRCVEILEAARKLFAKRGFSEVTMDEIAEAAGLAKGTLYLYFESKRDVYLKTLQRGKAELLERVTTNMRVAEGLRAKIRALIATRVKYGEENRDFYRIYLTEFSNVVHPASINKEFRDLDLKQARALEQALCEGMERGEMAPVNAQAAAFTIHDMAHSLITRRLLGWSERDVDEDIDFLCDFIWTGVGR
jgi:AcrR family transcriptional regulator